MQIKEFSFDEESNVNKLIIADEQGKRVFPLDMRLIKSIEYETLVRLNEALKQLENPPFIENTGDWKSRDIYSTLQRPGRDESGSVMGNHYESGKPKTPAGQGGG